MRARNAYVGLVLYLLVTQYLAFQLLQFRMDAWLFAAIFWIIHLFMAVIISHRLTGNGQEGSALFNYLMCHPRSFIFSRIVFIFTVLAALGLLSVLLMSVLYGTSLIYPWMLMGVVVIGSLVYAALFGFLGSLSSSAENAHVLVAVLGFPLLIPAALLTARLTVAAISQGHNADFVLQYFVSLSALALVVWALAYLLFPYLWRR